MIVNPWRTFREPERSREYLALLSELPLKSFRHVGLFLHYSGLIQKQLRTVQGILGYSVAVRPLQKRFWTLSVWESEAALGQFVGAAPHSQVMDAMSGKMGKTRFVKWTIRGADCPPAWAAALERRD
ncbi:MAG: hypothetical protein ACRENN_02450 [Candidatus Eiseniibacteriota bacterium]